MQNLTFKGTIRGRIIELDQEPGLPDGQEVTIQLATSGVSPGMQIPPGEGIRRSAGAWAEDAEDLDQFMEWSRQQRKHSRREIEE